MQIWLPHFQEVIAELEEVPHRHLGQQCGHFWYMVGMTDGHDKEINFGGSSDKRTYVSSNGAVCRECLVHCLTRPEGYQREPASGRTEGAGPSCSGGWTCRDLC